MFHDDLSALKSQRFLRFRCPSRTPEIARFPRQEKAMLHCDLRVRCKVASDLRFRAAISEPKTPSFCGISGDLALSTRKSLAIAIVRFWYAKMMIPCSTLLQTQAQQRQNSFKLFALLSSLDFPFKNPSLFFPSPLQIQLVLILLSRSRCFIVVPSCAFLGLKTPF